MHKRIQTRTTPALPTGGDARDVGPASTVMALCGEAAKAVSWRRRTCSTWVRIAIIGNLV